MYSMKNGVLHKNGRPVFCLGQSYYPSYHKQKIPVLETGDQLGEMKEDLHGIKEAGFNLVRMAARGDLDWNDGNVQVNFPLPDAFLRDLEEEDMAGMIRLQGYSMNLRGFKDATMVRADGKEMPFNWGWFVRNCLNHAGIYEDNVKGTIASARHFKDFHACVSFQIYNEPAYPSIGFYDYHPESIKAYKEWCALKGLPAEDPPRQRPAAGESKEGWINWRLFCMERMTFYLCDMGEKAREGYAFPESLTCHMACPVVPGASQRGEDYFETAKGMDILGITAYTPCRGPSYHKACMQLDTTESAAAAFKKHAWLIEYNARTNMPPQEWPRETYAAIGRGFKGILYYQWRADYPFPNSPEPEEFGMLFNDRRKAAHFDMGVKTNKVVNVLSERLARAEKVRNGVSLLWSARQNAYFDAADNGAEQSVQVYHERNLTAMARCYSLLNEAGVTVDFTRAEDLAENTIKTRVLILPAVEGLSDAELDQIDAFKQQGGRVYRYQDDQLGFLAYVRNDPGVMHGIITDQYDVRTLMRAEKIAPNAEVVGAPCVDARLLKGTMNGKKYAIAVLANYDPLEKPLTDTVLHVNGFKFNKATAYATDLPLKGMNLAAAENCVSLPKLHWGGFVVLENE